MSTQDKIQLLRAEADRLEQEATLREAYEGLRKISHAEYDVRKALDFPDELMPLAKAVEDAQRIVARRLGHDERAEILHACGMDKERIGITDLISDGTMGSCLATWLFDRYGHWHDDFERDSTLDELDTIKRARSYCEFGVKFWEEGRHDT